MILFIISSGMNDDHNGDDDDDIDEGDDNDVLECNIDSPYVMTCNTTVRVAGFTFHSTMLKLIDENNDPHRITM